MDKKGLLVIISGFAGSGKGTITKELIKRYDNYRLSISATTRNPREGEVDGREYFFKTRDEFEEMIENGKLLEHAEYVGNYYGTPLSFVEDTIKEGKDVILEIEYLGAFNVKEKFPDAVLVFLTPPSANEVYNRLKKRGTETEEVIRKRLLRAREEALVMNKYDYIVVNDDLEEAILNLHNTIQSVKNSSCFNIEFINKIMDEFEKI